MKDRPINQRLIISMFDLTGTWPSEYIKAGYPVILWDKQVEGDIISNGFFREIEYYADDIYGILSATPCDKFAGSGARWWPFVEDDVLEVYMALASIILIIKDWCKNLKFWCLENPVGRLEKLMPEFKPFRKMIFNPCDYGDPYTKKTILWGEFNTNLPKNPVLPLFGSMMHKIPPGPNQKNLRSATPKGFAKAFFEANP